MERDASSGPAAQGESEQWICHNCGNFNLAEASHCESCGFVKGYDQDALPAVAPPLPSAWLVPRAELPARGMLYLALAQTAALVLIAALLVPLLLRMQSNWPFQSAYEHDASALGRELLTLSASLELGMSKQQYDGALAGLLGASESFKGMYSASPERFRDSYQKLVQAAEFYRFAETTWEGKLRQTHSAAAARDALSAAADPSVQEYWQRARASALGALGDLR